MPQRYQMASILILALVAIGATSPVQAKNKVFIVIDGQEYFENDYCPNGEKKCRYEFAIDQFRPTLIGILAEKRVSNCRVNPEETEVREYIDWWHREVADIERRSKLGTTSTNRNNSQDSPLSKVQDVNIGNQLAREHATKEIKLWLAYNCIQREFGGDGFDEPSNFLRVLKENFGEDSEQYQSFLAAIDKNNTSGSVVIGNVGDLPFPPLSYTPVPIDSIALMFEDMQASGRVDMPNRGQRKWIIERYTNKNARVSTYEESRSRLEQAYWKNQP